jgi:hypothetical protein
LGKRNEYDSQKEKKMTNFWIQKIIWQDFKKKKSDWKQRSNLMKYSHKSLTWSNIFDIMLIFKVYDILFVELIGLIEFLDIIISFQERKNSRQMVIIFV